MGKVVMAFNHVCFMEHIQKSLCRIDFKPHAAFNSYDHS